MDRDKATSQIEDYAEKQTASAVSAIEGGFVCLSSSKRSTGSNALYCIVWCFTGAHVLFQGVVA